MQLTKEKKYILLGLDLNTLTLYTIYLFAFLIPLVVGHPQLLVGSAINFLIIFSTLRYGFKRSIPALVTPSLVATGTGLLFGGATLFLVYLLPFVILSNIFLSFTISKQSNIWGIFLGIVFKVIFLYTATSILVNTVGLPSIFLTSMGLIQIYTALIGGSIAFVLNTFTHKIR